VVPGIGWDVTAPEWVVESPAELRAALDGLAPGDGRMLAGHVAWKPVVREAVAAGSLWWFPLEPDAGLWRARAERPRPGAAHKLAAYLARDHRLMEAAWDQAPRGRAFHWRLERHMRVEERLLFPAWVRHGDRPGWARGLAAEHDLLRRPVLNSRIHMRAFRERLDSHDDKEERVFYPALMQCLDDVEVASLLREAMLIDL